MVGGGDGKGEVKGERREGAGVPGGGREREERRGEGRRVVCPYACALD